MMRRFAITFLIIMAGLGGLSACGKQVIPIALQKFREIICKLISNGH